jgi:hypothetical protein
MGVFDDKKFESLDWISQATEPIDSELNMLLGNIPDETVLDIKTILDFVGESYGMTISLDRAMMALVKKHNPSSKPLSWQEKDTLKRCFRLEIVGQPIIDFTTKTVSGGEVKVIRETSTLDEKDLKNILGREGIDAVRNGWFPSDASSRINEIFELLGKCDGGLKSRSLRKKRSFLYSRLIELFKTNEWNIKDTTLANKVGFWICDYIKDKNMAAMSNFCRLKVMTHKGQPIYSMEEVQ